MRYYMFNKPKGCVTARRDFRHKTVMEYFPLEDRQKIFPIGRLDKDTEGFLIVTDDGKFCFHINEPEHRVEKTYRFYARGEISEEKLRALEEGVRISQKDDKVTAPARVKLLGFSTMREIRHLINENEARLKHTRRGDIRVTHIEITITEGKKHQVKLMARAVGMYIVYLERISIGGVALDPALKRGEFRPLTTSELALLNG